MRNILVIGSDGYIVPNLVLRLLESGEVVKVVGLDNRSASEEL